MFEFNEKPSVDRNRDHEPVDEEPSFDTLSAASSRTNWLPPDLAGLHRRPPGLSRSPTQLQAFVAEQYCTVNQLDARTAHPDILAAANRAALEEGIRRSLGSHAFQVLGCAAPEHAPANPLRDWDLDSLDLEHGMDEPDHASNWLGEISRHNSELDLPRTIPAARVPTEIESERRDSECAAFGESNQHFRQHLERHRLQAIENSGRGNNCAIYALVQQVMPTLDEAGLGREVDYLRGHYDRLHPADAGKMLHLDNGLGGHSETLIDLINRRYGVILQVAVVQAGLEAEHPVSRLGVYRGGRADLAGAYTHQAVIWDQLGHYVAVTARADADGVTG